MRVWGGVQVTREGGRASASLCTWRAIAQKMGASTVRSMLKDSSVARGRKKLVGHENKKAALGCQWG